MTSPHVLVCDADQKAAEAAALGLDAFGFSVDWASLAPTEVIDRCRLTPTQLVILRVEMASKELSLLLARLEAARLQVPLVLVCSDDGEQAFVKGLTEGVVELVKGPFAPKVHAARLKGLLEELPRRPKEVRGRGGSGELHRFIRHVMALKRTGGLVVREGQPDEARAAFVKGVLKSARLAGQSGVEALSALEQLTAAWRFVEGAAQGTGSSPSSVVDPSQGSEGGEGLPSPPPSRPPSAVTPRPARPSAPPPRPSATAAAPIEVAPGAELVPLLFVDDEVSVVGMLAAYFSKRGYPVETAADGVEALEKLSKQAFEVVLSDLNMPRLDGWGLLRLLREDFRTHEVPVALYSAHDDYRESLRALHSGAQGYFSKTLKLSALEAQLQALVQPRRTFLASLANGAVVVQPFGRLGPQWVLRALEKAMATGSLDAHDGWATWRATLVQGRLVAMSGQVSSTSLNSERALISFLDSERAEGSFSPGPASSPEAFGGQGTSALLTRIVAQVNEEHRLAREAQLKAAQSLTVNEALYKLYRTVGPPSWQEAARLLCEAKLPPSEVLTHTGLPPQEIATLVRDLVRRGVVELRR